LTVADCPPNAVKYLMDSVGGDSRD